MIKIVIIIMITITIESFLLITDWSFSETQYVNNN